jgi:fatty acid desaturase
MRSRRSIDLKSLTALGIEWLLVLITLYFAARLATWWGYAVALVIVATRQHALLMLFHDAVHGLLARKTRRNDLIINLAIGVPAFLPVEVYRALHLAHHRELGTPADPERALLYAGQPWAYAPLGTGALMRQLLGDLLIVNSLRTLAAWARAGGRPKLQPATFAVVTLWAAAIAVGAWRAPQAMATALLLWFVPLLTLTQLLQKLRSFAEHSGGPGVTPGWDEWTYNWRVGAWGRLTIWPYNINLHQVHHAHPGVPWHELPRRVRATSRALPSSQLWALLRRRGGRPGPLPQR